MKKRMRAISIRQPYAEQILRRQKKEEFRKAPTGIIERVYIYASLRPAKDLREWRKIGKPKGSLPVGVLVGTVEIVSCRRRSNDYEYPYAYRLARPRRFVRPRRPNRHPQPVFFYPF